MFSRSNDQDRISKILVAGLSYYVYALQQTFKIVIEDDFPPFRVLQAQNGSHFRRSLPV